MKINTKTPTQCQKGQRSIQYNRLLVDRLLYEQEFPHGTTHMFIPPPETSETPDTVSCWETSAVGHSSNHIMSSITQPLGLNESPRHFVLESKMNIKPVVKARVGTVLLLMTV